MSYEAYQAKQKAEREARRAAREAKSVPKPPTPPPAESEDDEEPEPSFQTGGGFDALGAIDPDRTGHTVKPSKRALKRQAKQEAADKEAAELAAQQAAAKEIEQALTKKGKFQVPRALLTFSRDTQQETAEDRHRQRLTASKQKFEAEQARADIAAGYSAGASTKPQGGRWAQMAGKAPVEKTVEHTKELPTPQSYEGAKRYTRPTAASKAPSYEYASDEEDEDVAAYHAADREVPSGWDSEDE